MNFEIGKESEEELKRETKKFCEKLKKELRKQKVKAEVFLGGSLGKGTLEKSDYYDVDIFVRFKDGREISEKLEKVLRRTGEKFEKIHGSRDYFKIQRGNIDFEFIPVKKIRSPKEAENVTDLSYFHVNFVRKSLNRKLRNEVMIAKKFMKAQRVYGAESYVNGFSGYAVECLIINYKSFQKMLKELVKIEDRKLIIDIKKFYKKKEDVIIEMNEARAKSPIVLVDPTWRERNVLASLNSETFERFKDAAKKFLKKPSQEFFVPKVIDYASFSRRNKGENARIILKTDRQQGDIAGTKMKKFSRWLLYEIRKKFEVIDSEFVYEGGESAEFFVSGKSLNELVKSGPKKEDKKNAEAFRKMNKNIFEKEGKLFAKEKVNYTLANFLERIKKESKVAKEMGITDFQILEK